MELPSLPGSYYVLQCVNVIGIVLCVRSLDDTWCALGLLGSFLAMFLSHRIGMVHGICLARAAYNEAHKNTKAPNP